MAWKSFRPVQNKVSPKSAHRSMPGVHEAGEGFSPGVIRAVPDNSGKPQPPGPLLHGVFKQRMEKGVDSSAISL